MPGGSSSTWWVTSTDAGASGSSASRVRRRSRSSRPPRSMPAAGSSSSSSSGSVISARAICTRAFSPWLSVPYGALGQAADAEAVRAGRPRAGRPGARRPRATGRAPSSPALTTTSVTVSRARDAVGERRAGEADPRPQLEDVDAAEPLAEHPRLARRSGACGRRDLQQGGLAGAVRAEHGPALVLLDRPVDRGRAASWSPRRTVTLGELQDGVGVELGHVPSKRTSARRGGAPGRARVGGAPAQSAGPVASVTVAVCDWPVGVRSR